MIALQIVTGAALFLVAAKAHGRQLRLEREKAGVLRVSFGRGAENDPFVVALWRRERFIFWPAAALTAVALHSFRSLGRSPMCSFRAPSDFVWADC